MNNMPRPRRKVTKQTAAHWPSWTDQVAYDPTYAEQLEHAAMNESYDFDGPAADDPCWDQWAGEAIAQDQLERGLRMF